MTCKTPSTMYGNLNQLVLRYPTTALCLAHLIILIAACSSEDRAGNASTWQADYETDGDTQVVRTRSGSVWGDTAMLAPEVIIGVVDGPEEYLFGHITSIAMATDGTIYAVDSDVPALRVYNADGTYRTTFGRRGGGPGEYYRPDAGLNVLSDGRVLLRDPGNARIQVYSPEGESLDTWRLANLGWHGTRMIVDPLDRALNPINLNFEADPRDRIWGLVQMLPDGTVGDTLLPPQTRFQPPLVEARYVVNGEPAYATVSVPWTPNEFTAFSPMGYWIHGISTEYVFTVLRPEGPVRIEKTYDRVPVTPGERAQETAWVTRAMRSNYPQWQWNGPSIPQSKPPYRGLYAGEDGTIWVQLSQPGFRRDNPDYDPADPESRPDEWLEPILFDAFEENGRYLGQVKPPEEFNIGWRQTIFTRDWILSIVPGEYDVPRIVKFRVVTP